MYYELRLLLSLPSSFSWLIFMKDWAGAGAGAAGRRSVGRPTVRWRGSEAKIGCHLHNISKLYSAPQNQPSFLSDDGRGRTDGYNPASFMHLVALQKRKVIGGEAQVGCRIYASPSKKRGRKKISELS